MMDVPPQVRREQALRGARARRRLTFAQAEEIRQKHAAGTSYSKLVAEYGICKSLVSYIISRRTYALGQ
jgi:hypothetical protein